MLVKLKNIPGPRVPQFWPIGADGIENPTGVPGYISETLEDCVAIGELRGGAAFTYDFVEKKCWAGNLNTVGSNYLTGDNATRFTYIRRSGTHPDLTCLSLG